MGQVSQHILFLFRFLTENIEYDPESQNTILDYKVEVRKIFSVYILGNPIETKFLKLHFWESFCTIFFLFKVTPLDENDTMLLYGDMGNYSIGGFQFKFKAGNYL